MTIKPIPLLNVAEIARFDSWVNRSDSGCWNWLAKSRCIDGRGRIKLGGEHYRAPRVAWRRYKGSDPGQLLVLHTCDNPACVNPDHLFLGTDLDNASDSSAKGRRRWQSNTHCIHGHPFSGENLRVTPKGHRQCRMCGRQRYLSRQQAKKDRS